MTIIITSAHLAASATPMTLKPAASAFLADAPGRTAITTSLTPLSRMLSAMGMALAAEADDRDLLVS